MKKALNLKIMLLIFLCSFSFNFSAYAAYIADTGLGQFTVSGECGTREKVTLMILDPEFSDSKRDYDSAIDFLRGKWATDTFSFDVRMPEKEQYKDSSIIINAGGREETIKYAVGSNVPAVLKKNGGLIWEHPQGAIKVLDRSGRELKNAGADMTEIPAAGTGLYAVTTDASGRTSRIWLENTGDYLTKNFCVLSGVDYESSGGAITDPSQINGVLHVNERLSEPAVTVTGIYSDGVLTGVRVDETDNLEKHVEFNDIRNKITEIRVFVFEDMINIKPLEIPMVLR